jgi:polysaccharide export outer membrane protein
MRAIPILCCFTFALLTACSGLPIAGPTANEVVEQQVENNHQRYDLVEVDQHVVSVLTAQAQPSFHESFRQYGKPLASKIGIGDSVSVTIWQVGTGAPAAGTTPSPTSAEISTIALPVQVVGPDGGISIPYGGRIHVGGRLPLEVQRMVEDRLSSKIAGVQAIVTVASVYDVASVGGEVVNGTRVPLPLNGIRLLDVIAAAGGAKAAVFDTYVQLSRHDVTVTIPMEQLVSNPAENIYAWPGDVLTLISRPRSFIALGATGQNGTGQNALINIDRKNFTLAKAVARAGGLLDERADPTGVFLLRYEPASVVKVLHATELASGPGGSSPVIFRLDLRDPQGYLLAQSFPIQDDDVLYVANAPLTVTQKFLTLLNTLSGPIISGVAVTKR